MKNDIKLLENMIFDLNLISNRHYVGDYWLNYSLRIEKNLKKYGLENFRSNFLIGKGFADVIHDNPFLNKEDNLKNKTKSFLGYLLSKLFLLNKFVNQPSQKMINDYVDKYLNLKSNLIIHQNYNILKNFFLKYQDFDTLTGNPRDIIKYEDITIGSYYISPIINQKIILEEFQRKKYTSFFEIGGGFGANAHTLLSTIPQLKKYIYMDIPPVLYIGTQFLKHFFPNCVYDYEDIKKMDTVKFLNNNKIEIFCISPWQLHKVKSKTDFFLNAHSFQEINIKILKKYLSHIEKIMKDKNSVLLQFYEYDSKVKNTINPDKIINLLNENCKMKISKDREYLKLDYKTYVNTNFNFKY
tara:strand:+ start:746 stop:1810 length:1065 start_codon:yes stop_codon:yes gene_type:complete